MKFGAKHQQNENAAQVSLFGESSDAALLEPPMPICEPWSTLHMLNKEKEVVGFYISGHPLDDYKLEMENFCKPSHRSTKSFRRAQRQRYSHSWYGIASRTSLYQNR